MSQHSSRRAFWQAHYQRCRALGMTLKDYAEQEELTVSVFYSWSKRFRKEQAAGTHFHRVQVNSLATAEYRLHLPNALVLEWNGDADPAHLVQLVKSLT